MRPAIRELLLGAYDPDALAWRAIVRAGGGDVSPFMMMLVSRLIRALKAAGVWTQLDRLWLFAAENAQQALIDLVARATATAVNSPTFTANQGYVGNGTSSYINTGFNPTSGSPNYTRNSAFMAAWSVTASSKALSALISNDDLNASEIRSQTSPHWLYTCNAAAGQISSNPADLLGFVAVDRPNSSTINGYRNGSNIGTAASTSIAIPGNSFFLLAANGAGTPGSFNDAQIGAACMGASLGGSGQSSLDAALRSYMTAVGVP